MCFRKKFSQKGVYSFTTTFMLVVVLVVALLFLISFGAESSFREEKAKQSADFLKKNFELKEHLVNCIGGLNEENLDLNLSEDCIPEELKGFKVEKLDFFGCSQKEWTAGETTECLNMTSFYIIVDENKSCLGRMLLCFR